MPVALQYTKDMATEFYTAFVGEHKSSTSASWTGERELFESEPVPVWAGEVHRILGSRDPEIPSEGSERPSGLGVSTTAPR